MCRGGPRQKGTMGNIYGMAMYATTSTQNTGIYYVIIIIYFMYGKTSYVSRRAPSERDHKRSVPSAPPESTSSCVIGHTCKAYI